MSSSDKAVEARRQAALDGHQWARTSEQRRIWRDTETIDMRDEDRERGATCFRADLHEPHDYESETWCEPRWVNPRSVRLRWCQGVRDESPYERVLTSDEQYGVRYYTQDHRGMGPGEFAWVRRLGADRALIQAQGVVTIDTELWKTPPREWPPHHVGDKGCGVSLDLEATKALRDFLSLVITEHEEQA